MTVKIKISIFLNLVIVNFHSPLYNKVKHVKGSVLMKTIQIYSHQSIQEILDSEINTDELTIKLAPGIYREKLVIHNSNLIIEGNSLEDTIIVYNDYNYKIHQNGQIFNTFRTSSVNVIGNNVTFKNITVKNDAGHGEKIGQAVALSVYGNCFNAFKCKFESYQDTIFCGPLPIDLTIRYKNFLDDELLHTNPLECHFVDCVVIGAVDYIFGSAFAVFKHCHIISIGKGYIVAPSTYENQDYGFVFYHCTIENQANTSEVFLARPWREFGSCIFINCDFLGDFHPERYHDWNKSNYRFSEHPYVKSSLSKKIPSTYLEQLKIKVEEIC